MCYLPYPGSDFISLSFYCLSCFYLIPSRVESRRFRFLQQTNYLCQDRQYTAPSMKILQMIYLYFSFQTILLHINDWMSETNQTLWDRTARHIYLSVHACYKFVSLSRKSLKLQIRFPQIINCQQFVIIILV